ncbi:MAG: hypothetical protein DMG40_25610 [Acidobacteria bacterium]|nr:MAG: hypothetical protein DMG40_25610 [Acidobacteriota bacterium]
MRLNHLKACLKTTVLLTAVLLLGAGRVVAQQQVNLTAAPTSVTLPDGTAVPMWGYFCGAAVTGSTATCAALNPASVSTVAGVPSTWSPVVITVPTGQTLVINLTNSLSFAVGTATNTVPTSLTIVGQLGAGLGTTATSTPSPDHTYAQGCVTWPIASIAPGQQCNAASTGGVPATVPPTQGPRVQSFSTEVAVGATTALTWTTPRPGTFLLESGTHPSIQGPMGLYGMVVVTNAPSATAVAPATTTTGCAYTPVAGTACVVPYNAEADLLFSEIDPVQNNSVQAAVTTAGFSETMVWSGQPGGCGNPSSPTYHQCYPPAVNYTPLYYLINGVGFSKSNATASLFAPSPATGVTATPGSGILVRMVNAGLHMHVPSIVGSLTTPPVGTTGVTAAAVAGFSLIAEDGNALPGVSRVQSEVFMAAGKTYDVMIDVPAAGASALPVYDRELSLSGNATARDAGMLAYLGVNGAGVPAAPAFTGAVARADTYNSLIAGKTLQVADPGKGVIANDTNVYGVHLLTQAASGTVTLNTNGTFTYVPSGTATSDSFTYCANNAFAPATTTTAASCSSAALTATVTLGAGDTSSSVTCSGASFTANTASFLAVRTPGVLASCTDSKGFPLTATAFTAAGVSVVGDANGGFTATLAAPCTTPTGCPASFTFQAKNSQGVLSSTTTVNLTFAAASNLLVKVLDGADKTTEITDYRWIIEEDRTFYIDPKCTTNSATPIAGCTPQTGTTVPPTFGVNFHTSYMPLIAAGCTGPLSCEGGQTMVDPNTGAHVLAVCDIGNGVCRPDTTGNGFTSLNPSQVHLDPTKRYYISVLPGDAANPFIGANGSAPANCAAGAGTYNPTNNSGLNTNCGHGMGGAPIPALGVGASYPTTPYTILTQPTPFPPANVSVFIFEDDFPLNGEQDAGGGIPGAIRGVNEPGLGGFEITLFDDAGGTGDATGQLTHDMFNQPLSNTLAGTIDPLSGLDACPITKDPLHGMDTSNGNAPGSLGTLGITGRIVTCPAFEADGVTPSPLVGQALIPNMMQGRYGVVANPAADRIARGEEWLQTNTLDGQKAHDAFVRVGEPSYFQEYGPAGYHISIGFANPQIINSRLAGVCAGADPSITGTNCHNTLTATVTTERMSRTPDERLYSSGDNSSFAFTQCYVSLGDPDGEDFAFTKCGPDGSFTLSGLPDGDWRLTVFDQWNDMLVDGLSTPVRLAGGATVNMGNIAMNQWQANIYTSTFFDANGNGVRDANEDGLSLVSTNIRFRDGSYSNFNNTDLSGNAGFNEVFPLFSWYVIESDSTRYKSTGTHVVYDAGGPADGSPSCGATGYPACGTSAIGNMMANTNEPAAVALPTALRVPGAYYCSTADCTDAPSPLAPGGSGGSTGRVDPPWVAWPATEGWQGFSGQNSFLEFGKKPFVVGETGGIHGEVNYASTRPFDDPQLLLHVSWTPDVPNVTVNLYQEGVAADGVTTTLKLIDTTKTTSWDDWAQGFRSDGNPNMSCPGESTTDLFYFSLFNQPDYLDVYNNQHNGTPLHTIPNNSQFKCYDGMHNWNQLQPVPYDGMYQFPSVIGINPTTGRPATPAGVAAGVGVSGTASFVAASLPGTNCTICVPNPDTADPYRVGTAMLPAGKYVVEVVVPPGYELVKEEDKNILIGDNYIAPVTQQFGGLGAIYILPDQAAVGASYNATNAQNQTTDLGTLNLPRGEGDTGSVEQFWPCVGEARIVPDFMSIFPQAQEVAAFAGATRNLCDRKEITLQDQASALAKFYIFSSTHVAAHFTGIITDDFTSEFDPFSPAFGEKFSPPDMPVSIKDWAGNEISRVYSDHWGVYDGLTYSSWEVNPPNPTGYGPTMMVTCMNDPGPVLDTNPASPTYNQMITDPLFNPQYSQFCYEIPFMPGQTQYMDTPVVPTSAFAGAGYNNVDCSYPDATPAVKEVDGDGLGPWVSAAGHTLTITALGDQMVPNNAYAGPQATTAPFNQKFVKRHFGFGGTAGTVTIGGVPATVGNWSDTQIQVTVPNGVPPCPVQQQAQYGGSTASCGELFINTAATTSGTGGVTGVTVTNAGNGYTSRPAVTFNNTGSGGSGAAASTFLGVTRVAVPTSGVGRGYTSAPAVTFTASPAGAAATATGTAILGSGTTAGRVVGVTVTNPGSGYTARPTVTFAPPSCTINGTTCVRATLANSSTAGVFMDVVSVTVTSAGTNYTSNPTVTISAPSCTINTTTCVRATGTAAASPLLHFAGKQSIDTVTVTIGGKAPTHVHATDSIQAAIDAAAPGDLIIVDPGFAPASTAPAGTSCAGVFAPSTTCVESIGTHNELLVMWKPVRLQGVGAASSVINANTHPAGQTKMDAWHQRIVCLFGLGLNGSPVNTSPHTGDVNTLKNVFDPNGQVSCPGTGWNYFTAFDESGATTGSSATNAQVDRLPLESVVGWSAELNGNLAEQLQEPSLMGALEGAGITVLAKGVNFPSDPYDSTLVAGFPTGTTLLIGTDAGGGGNFPVGDANAFCHTSAASATNPFPSNYSCNPSSIDGLGITDSSQGGGGIFVHGWAHNLQIANNRIYSNAGTLSGGINIGQGEFAPPYTQGGGALNAPPGSCEDSPVPNAILPYCENVNVNIHNNYVAWNSSTGDELFSASPAGAGGVSICTGADYYKFNYNWVCGNLSSGDGGGVGHIGFTFNGDIEHNTILFNQSTNPTIPTNGGGLIIMGAPDQDLVCSTINPLLDQDCAPAAAVGGAASVTPSDGVGPGLVINANLIMGNAAESGTGAGIAFNAVNGTDMVNFPTDPGQWNQVTVTNNIIVDNVGGWDGAGISLADSPNVNIINNTIAYNASTASAGILFNTLGAPLASQGGSSCASTATTTCPQPGGLVALQHSAVLAANLPSGTGGVNVVCPPGHFQTTATNGSCRTVSYPKLENNIFWHNGSFYIGVGALSPQFQQNVVSLFNAFTHTAVASQPSADSSSTTSGSTTITGGTGACVSGTQYWDIAVRGDTGPTNHSSGVTLRATDSVLTPGASAVLASGNSTADPRFLSQYCDGSRTAPETPGLLAAGWVVPPGISDATVPNPIFNLTPSATVDEGNNWVNIAWGPLSMTNPAVAAGPYGNYGGGLPLGNYAVATGSSAAGRVASGSANYNDAPNFDFYNNPRKPGPITAGAVQITGTGTNRDFTVSPAVVDFGFVPLHSPTTLDQDIQVINTGSVALSFNSTSIGISCTNVTTGCSLPSFTIASNTCLSGAGTTSLAPGQACVVNVVFNATSTSQAQRNATLSVNPVGNGFAQFISLTGHDSIATLSISPLTPLLTAGAASNTTAKTGTITITNTANPNTNVDAGPWIPTAITLTQLTGTGSFTRGGTCAVGTAVNPGGTLVPPAAGSSCTITITYTPPATGSPNGSAHLTVTGLGTTATTNINATYNAN